MNEYKVSGFMMARAAYVVAGNKWEAAEKGRFELTGFAGRPVYFEGAMGNEAVFEDGAVFVVEIEA